MSRVVIFGGHGKVALAASTLLRDAGYEIVSVIRNPEHADEVEAAGARPLLLSVEDATQEALASALDGADAVVWSAGAGGKGGPERTDAVDRQAAIRSMEAARQAGVRRYLMVSWAGSYGDEPVPADHPLHTYAMAKLDADRHLVASDLDWTILGPGTLTTEPASGEITVERTEDGGSLLTSRENVARVILGALEDDATIRKVIPFRDGSTPIAQALAQVPQDYADLS
ncbi:SDR family oxidoreductase [Actinomyces faecalis]|uniref:SDR family oxidoreductase n=1 Tax=Actinomyces faecalis TaxID=2722820 RepID=UPI001554F6DC|nr:SDR family oxidoreductase [Actinomyces faecalis]